MLINNLKCFFRPVSKLFFSVLLVSLLSACVTERNNALPDPSTDKVAKAENYTQLGANYLRLGRYDVAEEMLEKALDLVPDLPRGNYVSALLMLRLEKPNQAERFFRRSLAGQEKNSVAAHDFGVFLCRSGRTEESLRYFDRAIKDPAFANKAISYLRGGECAVKVDINKAQQYFQAAYQLNPGLNVALYRAAEAYYLDKKPLQARAFYERFVAAAGNSSASLLLGYRIEKLAGSEQEADRYRRQLLERYPGSKEAQTVRNTTGARG